MNQIVLTAPDDWHLHVRDGSALASLVPHSARQFARALIMPNLRPPVTTVAEALRYRERILDAISPRCAFTPYMSLYLTEATQPEEVARVAETPEVLSFKLYPAGATTNSESGVASLEKIYPLLECMERHDVPLQVHGEVTEPEVDIFDREARFIEAHLEPITRRFPALRVVLEHVTTREGVDFVREAGGTVAATITAHHLLYNRNALLVGGVRPHFYCLPILKRETHRRALLEAATRGNPKFFLGTDSAPHPRHAKECASGCAGCYTAHAAMELYAQAFESAGALERLDAFASRHGADFFRLPRNEGQIELRREAWSVPETLAIGEDVLIPLRAGETLSWRVQISES
ncbi:MAG TPA: dihydroorotase [Methylococcaceae bacterium]|nr:dihydroorotase [Methylococcaceae bacterium]